MKNLVKGNYWQAGKHIDRFIDALEMIFFNDDEYWFQFSKDNEHSAVQFGWWWVRIWTAMLMY